jgi:hypothetical protein
MIVSLNLGLGFDTSFQTRVSLDPRREHYLRPFTFQAIAQELFYKSYNQCTAVERTQVTLIWIRIQDTFVTNPPIAEPKCCSCVI